jgi:hypothetical protein
MFGGVSGGMAVLSIGSFAASRNVHGDGRENSQLGGSNKIEGSEEALRLVEEQNRRLSFAGLAVDLGRLALPRRIDMRSIV